MIARIKCYYSQINGLRAVAVMSLMTLLILSACAQLDQQSKPKLPVPDVAQSDLKLIKSLPEEPLAFNKIKPVLEKRCIVCHGCYDAPCQLKLSSFEGIDRGAHKLPVYKKRLTYQDPTRMFIDANSRGEWRKKGFFNVLNEGSAEENLKNSLIYQMLNLKRKNPLPESGKLPQDYENPKVCKKPKGVKAPNDCEKPLNLKAPGNLDVNLDREQVCTSLEDFGDFAQDHKNWGMPFAVPSFRNEEEYKLLVQWLARGERKPDQTQNVSTETAKQIDDQVRDWENFFNGSSLKQQLVSRYIYEHLVLGHIHFPTIEPNREFFRLVRSSTKVGEIKEIPTVRPYDDPYEYLREMELEEKFYYRLRPYKASIVDKSHIVYELSPRRMQRYIQLFLEPKYKNKVTKLPSYDEGESANYFKRTWQRWGKLFGIIKPSSPFEVFSAIPVESRYQFLLDESRFFINGFIKGPVCRGLSALSSIEDHFWVFFLKPEHPTDKIKQHGLDQTFIAKNYDLLHMPTELNNTNRLFAAWLKYWPDEQKYMQAKFHYYMELGEKKIKDSTGKEKKLFPIKINDALKQFVWDGARSSGSTPDKNAALTVFRHLDSASVHHGLIGDEPETAWVIDYPVFERLHYLLVAGFNMFGTYGHQAAARLYMDFLRMEGEDNFLFFLPEEARRTLYEEWHRVDRKTTRDPDDKTKDWLDVKSTYGYDLENEPNAKALQQQLFRLLRNHVQSKSDDSEDLNRCHDSTCFSSGSERQMKRLANLKGEYSENGVKYHPLEQFPASSYVRVGGKNGSAYTLINNKSYQLSLAEVTPEEGGQPEKQRSFPTERKERERDKARDTLTVVKGLAGAYPNFFFDLKQNEVEAFVAACEKVKDEASFENLVVKYGIRRTNPKFWEVADWFQDQHDDAKPVESGILDLSRYRDL
jgi:hypothetical protein